MSLTQLPLRMTNHLRCASRILPYLVVIALFGSSCKTLQAPIYFNNVKDTLFKGTNYDIEPVIRSNDLLSITVSSLNPEASAMFNAPNTVVGNPSGSVQMQGTATPNTGYLVNPDGNIHFPILGNVKAAGFTKQELKDAITKALVEKKLLVDPIVNIRFSNFRVTILGEVARPTVVSVPNEKISILEAIGLAGDLTIFAKRDNVVLIREEGGNKMVRRLNLNSTEIFNSPYYYLKSNDVIYAEPNENKITSTSQTRQWLPVVISGATLIVLMIDRLFIN